MENDGKDSPKTRWLDPPELITQVPMRIEAAQHHLRIDFQREAPWALLVVDDMWHHVRNMVRPPPTPYGSVSGLEERILDVTAINEYWDRLPRRPDEPLVRSLLLIPWAMHSNAQVGEVVISPFPNSLTVDFVRSVRGPDASRSVAALVDVFEKPTEQPKFTETWKLLDEAEVPLFARAMFTRGGIDDPALKWTEPLPKVVKSKLDSGVDAFRAEIMDWWRSLLEPIGPAGEMFQDFTSGKDEHDPSTIDRLKQPDRSDLLSKLYRYDPLRAWRWAGELVTREFLSKPARERWLAAKAAYTWPGSAKTLPVTGLIGLLGGINACPAEQRAQYSFDDSRLATIGEADIDRLPVLGVIHFADDKRYEKFACALRDLLLHPEQFREGRATVRRVSLQTEDENNSICLRIEYSGALPDAIIATSPGSRRGSARRAYEAVTSFAHRFCWDSALNTISLSFRHER